MEKTRELPTTYTKRLGLGDSRPVRSGVANEEAVAARYKFSNASKAAIDPHSIFRAHTTDWSGRRTAAISITIMTLNPPFHIKKAKKRQQQHQ